MQLDAKVMTQTPSSRPTTPRLKAVPVPSVVPPSPRWVEIFRGDPGYSVVTVSLDLVTATVAVALAHMSFPDGLEDERNIGLYSWLFVPIVLSYWGVHWLVDRKATTVPRHLVTFRDLAEQFVPAR